MSTRRRNEYKLHYFNLKGRGELARLIMVCKSLYFSSILLVVSFPVLLLFLFVTVAD